jgi:outer membrane protein
MKKTLTLALFVCSLSVAAQTSKGSFLIGGNGSLNFNNNNADGSSYKTSSFSLSPTAGYFVAKNFSAGLSLPFELSRSKITPPSSSEEFRGNTRSMGVAPFVRYYIPIKSWFIVTEWAYGWYYTKQSSDVLDQNGNVSSSYEGSSHNRRYRLAVGPAFFLSPYTSIEILGNYGRMGAESANLSKFYVSVGFQIYLPSKKE